MQPLVCFAHGKESGPWGRKITALAEVAEERGLEVMSPDYRFTTDPDARVQHLLAQDALRERDLILVGSSMGGYVSAVASATLQPRGLFLLAPAVDVPGSPSDTTPRAAMVDVVHGWQDGLIPPATVVAWSQRHAARLHLVDSEHTLTSALPWIRAAFDTFLGECLDKSASAG